MVTDAILNAVYAVLNGLLALVPSVGINWAGSDFGTLLVTANMVAPISEVMAFARVLVPVAVAGLGLWIIIRVIDWLPFT